MRTTTTTPDDYQAAGRYHAVIITSALLVVGVMAGQRVFRGVLQEGRGGAGPS